MYGWGKGAASHTTLVVSLLDWGSAGKAESVARECPCILFCARVSIDILDLVP